MPNYWKTFHGGDCTVYRTEIQELRDDNTIQLRSGEEIATDCLLLCTGFDKSYQPFSQELQYQCDLAPQPDSLSEEKWARLERDAEDTVDQMFPVLSHTAESIRASSNSLGKGTGAEGEKKRAHHGPNRHYRRLISPSLAAEGDRSIIFPGFIHSIYTPLVSETQALWGVAFMLNKLELPSRGDMETEVATWNVWSRKRYPTQGRKHAYAIYDFLPVRFPCTIVHVVVDRANERASSAQYVDTLLKDLGVNTRRVRNPFTHLFVPAYPREFRGLVSEFRQAQAEKKSGGAKVVTERGQTADAIIASAMSWSGIVLLVALLHVLISQLVGLLV